MCAKVEMFKAVDAFKEAKEKEEYEAKLAENAIMAAADSFSFADRSTQDTCECARHRVR